MCKTGIAEVFFYLRTPKALKTQHSTIPSSHFLMPHFHIKLLKERIHLVGSQGYCEMNCRPFALAFILCENGQVVTHEAPLGFNEQIQTVFKCNETPAINRSSLCQAAVEVNEVIQYNGLHR